MDFQALISYCNLNQIEQLFFNFYPDSSKTESQNFINRLKELNLDSKLSPAIIQGHFLMYKNSPSQAIANAAHIKSMLPTSSLNKGNNDKVKTS